MNNINQSFNIKIIVIGNSNTGKTSFVKYWTKQHFYEKYKATITSEFEYKIMKIKNKIYRINVWDLGGQDNNIHLQKLFTKDCNCVIIFSDLNDDNLKATLKWKKIFLNLYEKFNFPIVCIQNKIDLVDEEKIKEIEKKFNLFWKENEFNFGFLTSAKNGKNVNESMNFIINEIDKKLEENYLNIIKNNNENNKNLIIEEENKNILLNLEKKQSKNKKNCC